MYLAANKSTGSKWSLARIIMGVLLAGKGYRTTMK
jgi:hypothetical protein